MSTPLQIHVYLHQDTDVKLDKILALLGQTEKELIQMAATVADRLGALNADVDTLEAADKAAFDRLAAQIAAGQTLSAADSATFDALEARLVADANAAAGIGVPPAP